MINSGYEFYNTAIEAVTRKFHPSVYVTWSQGTIDKSIETTATSENRISYLSQTYDGKLRVNQHNGLCTSWAHLDGTTACDMLFYPAPAPGEINRFEFGWWSDATCDGNGVFNPPQQLSISFNQRPINFLTISFYYHQWIREIELGNYNGELEYATDYDVFVFNGDSTEFYGNYASTHEFFDDVDFIPNINVDAVDRILLSINKWSKPHSTAKILEFYNSYKSSFFGDAVKSIDLLEETEIKGSNPIGNISCNELSLSLQNINVPRFFYFNEDQSWEPSIDDPFVYGNTDSPFNNVLLKNRIIEPYIALEDPTKTYKIIIGIPLGKFWSGDWDSKEQGTVVTTTARDRMEFFRLSTFKKSLIYKNYTIADLAEILCEQAIDDIPVMLDLVYEIDPALNNYTISNAYFKRVSYFECFKNLMEACMGFCYMSRNDVLIFRGPE